MINSYIDSLELGSTPYVGSSITKISGSFMIDIPILNFRFSPPDKFLTRECFTSYKPMFLINLIQKIFTSLIHYSKISYFFQFLLKNKISNVL